MIVLIIAEIGTYLAYSVLAFTKEGDFTFEHRMIFYQAISCMSTLNYGLFYASTCAKLKFHQRKAYFKVSSVVLVILGVVSCILSYVAYSGSKNFKIPSLAVNFLLLLTTLVFSVVLLKHVCILTPELDRNTIYGTKKEAISASILVIASLVTVRPLVMMAFSHGYFPTLLLLISNGNTRTRENFLSYQI